MKINILNFEDCDITITEYRIPFGNEIEKIEKYCSIKAPWWFYNDNVAVNSGYSIWEAPLAYKQSILKTAGVRPVLMFESKKPLSPGSEFVFGDHIFIVFNKNKAVCKTVIGYSVFATHNNPSCLYKSSQVYKLIKQWYNSAIDPIVEISDKQEYEIICESPTLLDVETASGFSRHIMKGVQPFWLYGRKDEFTGFSVTYDAKAIETPLDNKEINIHPVFKLSISYPNMAWVHFELNGLLFILRGDKGYAICKNTIGTSCYSTGIANLNECTEQEFFENSEVKHVMDAWFKTL